MPNNLTGDYESVFQISVAKINALLATMHQRGIDPAASPAFPHSVAIPIDDKPPFSHGLAGGLAQWLKEFNPGIQGSGMWHTNALPLFATRSLPSVSNLYEKAISGLYLGNVVQPESGRFRGTAYAQISTPTMVVRPGSTGDIMIRVEVRAQYVADLGTAAMPEPIHGQVSITYNVEAKTINGRRVVHVKPPATDAEVQFYSAPSAGLPASDIAVIVKEVRKILKTHFIPDDVDLPTDLNISDFIAVVAGNGETLALPIPLPGGGAGGNLTSITANLLGGNDFALAVSKDYVNKFFAEASKAMKSYAARTTIFVSTPAFDTVYHLTASDLTVIWAAGHIDISGKIHAHTESILPDQDVSFSQRLILVVDVPTQTVKLVPDGDPSVAVSDPLDADDVAGHVKAGRDDALKSIGIAKIFGDIRNQLTAALQKFDNYAEALYQSAEITPDGMIVRGQVNGGGSWIAPVVDFHDNGDAITAYRSWIPGGTVESFGWTWPEGPAWFSQVGHKDEADRFYVKKTPAMQQAYHICLRINGTRVAPDGSAQSVTGGQTCKPSWSEPLLVVPAGWVQIMMPFWGPRPPEDGSLEDAVRGHINLAGRPNNTAQLVANTLVHFTGTQAERPLQQLGQVMMESRRQDASLVLILVLPRGTLLHRRAELEAKLGMMNERFAGTLLITEDYEGGWTTAFATRETPATYLLNAKREFAWSHFGEIDIRQFAAALDEHMVSAPGVRVIPMQTRIDIGRQIPGDIVLANAHGDRTKLGRLRGRNYTLCFWQSWSQACMRELRRLNASLGNNKTALVLGINGGENREVIAPVREEHRLTFPLLLDPDQLVADHFGIQCWPTTIHVNRDGVVEQLHFGVGRDDRTTAA